MEKTKAFALDSQELLEKMKIVLIINDHIKTNYENIDEINISKICRSYDIKYKELIQIFQSCKNKTYEKASNLNRKTQSFNKLMEKIFLVDPNSKLFKLQLYLAYNLINMYHKDSSKDIKSNSQKLFTTFLFISFNNKNCLNYLNILKQIGLIKNEIVNDSDIQFKNKCEIIKNLNRTEFNSSLSSFLLMNDKIPQYKNIKFPNLLINDNEIIYNQKIENISNLLEVINSSLIMNEKNIRFELFQKYKNQCYKLDAINQVLASLNKEKLDSLSEGELEQLIKLHQENSSFLVNENQKNLIEISKLNNDINNYKQNAKELIDNLEKTRIKLNKTENKVLEMKERIAFQKKEYDKIYENFQKIKNRDICSFIIEYFICLLNDEDYNIGKSNYKTAVEFIVKEINISKYANYRIMLSKENIDLKELLSLLIEHKLKLNSAINDSDKKEEEFIKLIVNLKDETMGQKFRILFNKTPLLKTFCFVGRNEITRAQIRDAISRLKNDLMDE